MLAPHKIELIKCDVLRGLKKLGLDKTDAFSEVNPLHLSQPVQTPIPNRVSSKRQSSGFHEHLPMRIPGFKAVFGIRGTLKGGGPPSEGIRTDA